MELESIKKIYAGYSNIYDAIFKRFFYPRIEYAITNMNIRPGEWVLDVGVGTGLSLPLFPRHCRVVGIDLSGPMLKKAKEKIEANGFNHITVLQMDAMNVAFEDDSFDRIFISHVVSVVPDPHKVMSEVKRVCKKGGQIVIVNHFKSNNRLMAKIEELITPLCEKIGWRSDLSFDELVSNTKLRVDRRHRLKRFDLWDVVFAVNEK